MKRELQIQIAKGKLKLVLAKLLEASGQNSNEELHQEILLQSAKYEQYLKDKRSGGVDSDMLNVTINRINQAVLEIIENLPDKPGLAKIESKQLTYTFKNSDVILKIIFGTLVFIILLIASFNFFKSEQLISSDISAPLQLTVYVHGSEGRQHIVLQDQGRLILDLRNDRRIVRIGEGGRTVFSEINSDFLGKQLMLSVEADGFELAFPDSVYIYNGNPIYLAVKRNSNLGVVQGKVLSRDGSRFLKDVLIEVAGEAVYTDSLGNFRISIPEHKWKDEYVLYAKKGGYKLVKETYYPRLGEAEIRLLEAQ